MPRPNAPRTMGSESGLRRRVAYERELKGMSPAGLAARMTQVGCPIHQSAIWKIENATRRISVDELVAFCRVFDLPEAELLIPPEVAVDRRARELAKEYDAAIARAFTAMGELVQHVDRNPAVREAVGDFLSPLARRVATAFALNALDRMKERWSAMSDEQRERLNDSLYRAFDDDEKDG